MDTELSRNELNNILEVNEKLSYIKDVDYLLEKILTEIRRLTHADAGSIYLLKKDKLSFEFVQNETLRRRGKHHKYSYNKHEIPIDNESIAGYVGLTRKPLVIEDVYKLENNLPYSFNKSYDEFANYRTKSILTIPMLRPNNKLVGLIQIINAKDNKENIVPFTKMDRLLTTMFANQAAIAIERALMTREIILRMIKLAELRDPAETGNHVKRVSAYAVEIYQHWARKNNITEDQIEKITDVLRISAMLHDIGKVAISDSILNKRSRLNNREYDNIKMHTVYGARLFTDSNSDWDDMAAEITLNHHEKWDGTGYPGHLQSLPREIKSFGPGKKGYEIPLSARIVSLADVYDALISRRVYKESWPEEKVLDYIISEKNSQFDPELVDSFVSVYDIIKAIHRKYAF